MPLPERATCGDCGVLEGQIHRDGCDLERCVFCGHQRISCGCPEAHFYPAYRRNRDRNHDLPKNFAEMTTEQRAAHAGLPLQVYKHGLPARQLAEWRRIEAGKGRLPFILYPNICRRCGELWPPMFSVSDEEWERYVQPSERGEMLCLGCYEQIKGYIDGAPNGTVRGSGE